MGDFTTPESKNSRLNAIGLFVIAASILLHAWWPPYNAKKESERRIDACISELNAQPDHAPRGSVEAACITAVSIAARDFAAVMFDNYWRQNLGIGDPNVPEEFAKGLLNEYAAERRLKFE